MEVSVEHLGGTQFEIKARQHTIVCDQPPENGGYDEGMTPPELLLASLGSCAAFYAAMYLKKHKLSTEGTRVHVSAEKAKAPARMEDFRITVEVPAEFSDDHKRGHPTSRPSMPDSQHFVESAEDQPGSSERRFGQVLTIAWKRLNQASLPLSARTRRKLHEYVARAFDKSPY